MRDKFDFAARHSSPEATTSTTKTTVTTMSSNKNMRVPKRVITGHNREGKGIIETVDEGTWTPIAGAGCDYNVMWATQQFPHDLNKDWSKQEKEQTVMSLSLPNGTVLRMVDRAPGTYSAMHRTQSLDYGIVIEGEMKMIMDSGETVTLYPGDTCIQRGTNHQWHNPTNKYVSK